MNNRDIFMMALGNLWRRKARTILTILGVVIGTTSIVVMVSLGFAMDQNFKESLEQMGSLNMIEVHSGGGYYEEPGMRSTPSKEVRLDDQAVETLRQIPCVRAVMPIKSIYMRVVAGKMVGDISIIGIDPQLMDAFDFKAEEGRLLSIGDKNAIVFGQHVRDFFYDPRSRDGYSTQPPQVKLVNAKLMITSDMEYGQRRTNSTDADEDQKKPKQYEVRGIGILAESNSEKDYNAYMNMEMLKKIMKEDRRKLSDRNSERGQNEREYERLSVKVQDIQDVEKIQEQIKSMGFQAFSLTDMLKSMKKTSKTIRMVLGGIGGVSLLVAAIGITNTMIMSIYERTREIGVMKVLGANLTDIRKLFLLEAGIIGFGGGLIGLIFSYIVSVVLNVVGAQMMGEMGMGQKISMIPIGLALSGIGFATLVGIASGYSPARRAMNLSALEAIRTE